MPLTLRLYTDFVCPFCFIAEQSTVPRLLRELDLELDWYGFELHPSTPPGGKPLSELFPGVPLPGLHERTRRFALSFGVELDPPDWLHNSRKALSIAEYARDESRLEPFRQAAMKANWQERKDLESADDLRELAAKVGLDPERALAAASDPALLARVDERQAEARKHGVRGIPTFVFGREVVVGCQPFDTLLAAARRAGAGPR